MALFFQLQHRVAHPYQHQQSPAKYPGRVIARVSSVVFHYYVAKEPIFCSFLILPGGKQLFFVCGIAHW
jgi:hypothetical protein